MLIPPTYEFFFETFVRLVTANPSFTCGIVLVMIVVVVVVVMVVHFARKKLVSPF